MMTTEEVIERLAAAHANVNLWIDAAGKYCCSLDLPLDRRFEPTYAHAATATAALTDAAATLLSKARLMEIHGHTGLVGFISLFLSGYTDAS